MNIDRELLSKFILTAIMIFSFTYGWTTAYPNDVYVSYGFPLRWGTYQIVTIVGRVDRWIVNITALLIDLVLWMILMILIPILLRSDKHVSLI